MLCVPSLGSESSVLESCSCFYTGLDISTLIGPPVSKLDVGRFSSKKQCSYIPSYLGSQQESPGSPSSVAGVWHCGSNALTCFRSPSFAFVNGSYEQAFNASKPSMKSANVAKHAEKVLKDHFLTGSKPSQQNYSRVKSLNHYFENHLDEFERIPSQSQVPCNGTNSSVVAQEIPSINISVCQQMGNNHLAPRSDSFDHDMRGPHALLPQCVEQQISGVNTPSLHVEDGCPSIMHSEHVLGTDFTGKEPVWKESFLRGRRAHSSSDSALGFYASKQVSSQRRNAGINGSPLTEGINAESNGSPQGHGDIDFQGAHVNDGVGIDAHHVEGCQPQRQSHNALQHLEKEEQGTGDVHLINGQGYPDTQLSGNTNCSSVTGFDLEKQGYGTKCQSRVGLVLKAAKEEEMQANDFTSAFSASCKVAAIRMPVYRIPTHVQEGLAHQQRSRSDVIFYLESLGADCSRIFKDNPMAMKCTVKKLRALVCALERSGLKWNDLGRVFNLCPKILHLRPETDLKIVTSFLFDEVGLQWKDLGKVIKRCPRLLIMDVDGQLRPTLSFLRSLGYSKMGHVVSNNPTLLSFSVERKLIPKLRFLESLGFTYGEAASMVVRFPAIFNYSISENLQPKYDYLVHEMGGRNKDLLAFPQYFGYSLQTRIRLRHQCVAKHNVSLSIEAILKLSDTEFDAKFACGKGQSHLSKEIPVPPETNDVKLHDCGLESLRFVSFEHPGTRVLVSV